MSDLYTCAVCGARVMILYTRPEWGHGFMCCDEECGESARDALKELRQTPDYVQLDFIMESALERMQQLESETIKRLRTKERET